jgi:hypothetical protein
MTSGSCTSLPRGALREDYKIEVNSPTTQSYAHLPIAGRSV